MFKPVRKERVFEAVLEQLKDLIRARQLAPGDRLPPERELAESLAVSRSSLREALRLLEALGVVESKPGGGTVLQQPRLDIVFQSLGAFLYLDEVTNVELFQVRRVLEGLAVQLAATRAQPEDLVEMQRWLDILLEETDVPTLANADFQYHRALVLAAGHSLLRTVWEFFSGLISESMEITRHRLFAPQWLAALAGQHRLIYEAIANRDATSAERAMVAHLTFAEEHLYGSAVEFMSEGTSGNPR